MTKRKPTQAKEQPQNAAITAVQDLRERAQERFGEVKIQVDFAGMTWGDMSFILSYDGTVTPELIDFLDHVVAGGVKSLPFWVTSDKIMDVVMAEFQRIQNGAGTPEAGN